MKVKNVFTGVGILFVLSIIYGIYKIATFSIFDADFKLVEQISIPNKEYSLEVYHIPSNASSQSYIQIRKNENGIQEVLESYERYNQLDNYKITNQDTLILIISDSIGINERKEVKMKMKLP